MSNNAFEDFGKSVAEGFIDGLRNPLAIDYNNIIQRGRYDPSYRRGREQALPYAVIEENCRRIVIYKAPGFGEHNTSVEQNWNNKNREMTIEIKGVIGFGDFEEELNIHMLLDTAVYDKYEVHFEHGLITIIFHEIINAPPEITRITYDKPGKEDKI